MSSAVNVLALEPGRRILIDWSAGETSTVVEWTFTARSKDSTFVRIINSGFTGNGDQVVAQALDSAAGFELVLAGLKAYHKHGIIQNLVSDRFPEQNVDRSIKD